MNLRRVDWRSGIVSIFLMTAGALLGTLSLIVFLAPFDIAPGGASGVAIILNRVIGTPIGLVVLVINIPIQLLAYRMLHGWRVVITTVYVVLVYSLAIDLITPYLPPDGVSDNVLLNALFGGVLGGISGGMIYRAGATFGGTSTLARILQNKFGLPMSSTFIYTDLGVIALAGLVFGWEAALYAVVALFVGGVATDYVMEGPSVIRTAIIITDQPQLVTQAIFRDLQRGVTSWQGTGMFTEHTHSVLFVTVSRPQVRALRRLVLETDPGAFIVIGQGHDAYGEGFKHNRLPG
jgi:uncharacterized membrane-anchored protein YitT (DUF2179 family)